MLFDELRQKYPCFKKERSTFEAYVEANHISCKQFYDDVKADPSLLRKVKGTAEYSWAESANKFVLFRCLFFCRNVC